MLRGSIVCGKLGYFKSNHRSWLIKPNPCYPIWGARLSTGRSDLQGYSSFHSFKFL
jgi:hypothetical protein